jgi:hypothetical protein
MNVLTPSLLASEVLDQNRRKIRRKKKSQAIGFPAPFRQRLVMGNTTEINDMDIDRDDNDSSMVMGVDLDEFYGQSKSCNSCCSALNDDFYIDHPGPSTLSNNDPLSLDFPMTMVDRDEADGQLKLRRSGRIKHSKSFQNISHVGEDIYICRILPYP